MRYGYLVTGFFKTLWLTIRDGLRSQVTHARCIRVCLQCDKLENKGSKLYCGACECPQWAGAELATKLRMRYACPLGKFDADGRLTPDEAERRKNSKPHHEIDRRTRAGRKQIRDAIYEQQARQIFPDLKNAITPRPCCGKKRRDPEYMI